MKVTSPQSGSRFQPRKLSRTNSALILPKRRIASTAAACIWVTSDLPSSPLIFALIIGPDASMMVNAIRRSPFFKLSAPPAVTLCFLLRPNGSLGIIAPIFSGLLCFELYFHALPCEIELASLNRGHEVHNHAVLIFHRCSARAAALSGLRFNLLV